jgi:hypothetical protein
MSNSEILSSLDESVLISGEINNINDIYQLIIDLVNKNKYLPKYLNIYNSSSVPSIEFENNRIAIEGPIINIYKMLLSADFIRQINNNNLKLKRKNTITKTQFNKFKVINANQSHTCIKCPILYENFKIGQPLCITPCNHIFDKNALMDYLTNYNKCCPLCRADFK